MNVVSVEDSIVGEKYDDDDAKKGGELGMAVLLIGKSRQVQKFAPALDLILTAPSTDATSKFPQLDRSVRLLKIFWAQSF